MSPVKAVCVHTLSAKFFRAIGKGLYNGHNFMTGCFEENLLGCVMQSLLLWNSLALHASVHLQHLLKEFGAFWMVSVNV